MRPISKTIIFLLIITAAPLCLFAAPSQDYLRRNEVAEMAMENAQDSQTMTVDDASLKRAIEKAFKAEAFVGPSKIYVDTFNGVVILTGTALNEAKADRIVELARSTHGVKDVVVNIQLKDEKRPYQLENQ